VTFLVMHGDAWSPLDPVAEGANPLSPDAQKNWPPTTALDRPLYQQFRHLHRQGGAGDFGNSFVYKTRR